MRSLTACFVIFVTTSSWLHGDMNCEAADVCEWPGLDAHSTFKNGYAVVINRSTNALQWPTCASCHCQHTNTSLSVDLGQLDRVAATINHLVGLDNKSDIVLRRRSFNNGFDQSDIRAPLGPDQMLLTFGIGRSYFIGVVRDTSHTVMQPLLSALMFTQGSNDWTSYQLEPPSLCSLVTDAMAASSSSAIFAIQLRNHSVYSSIIVALYNTSGELVRHVDLSSTMSDTMYAVLTLRWLSESTLLVFSEYSRHHVLWDISTDVLTPIELPPGRLVANSGTTIAISPSMLELAPNISIFKLHHRKFDLVHTAQLRITSQLLSLITASVTNTDLYVLVDQRGYIKANIHARSLSTIDICETFQEGCAGSSTTTITVQSTPTSHPASSSTSASASSSLSMTSSPTSAATMPSLLISSKHLTGSLSVGMIGGIIGFVTIICVTCLICHRRSRRAVQWQALDDLELQAGNELSEPKMLLVCNQGTDHDDSLLSSGALTDAKILDRCMHAIMHTGDMDQLRALCQRVFSGDKALHTSLIQCVLRNQHAPKPVSDAAISVLLEFRGVNAIVNEYGDRMLHICATFGSERQLNTLLALGAEPRSLNSSGHTPLTSAVVAGQLDLVTRLLGVTPLTDILLLDTRGWNAFHWACSIGNQALVRLFEPFYQDLFLSKTATYDTVLHILAQENHHQLLQSLLHSNRNLLALMLLEVNDSYETALDVANNHCSNESLQILQVFVDMAKITPDESEEDLRSRLNHAARMRKSRHLKSRRLKDEHKE